MLSSYSGSFLPFFVYFSGSLSGCFFSQVFAFLVLVICGVHVFFLVLGQCLFVCFSRGSPSGGFSRFLFWFL